MKKPQEGGEHRRHAFFTHDFNGDDRLFWNLVTGLGGCYSRHVGAIFNAAPRENPLFPGKCRHFFRPEKSLASFSGGVNDAEPFFFSLY